MKFITARTSFQSGKISPKLHGRTDIREHESALSIADNALIGKHGGAYKRYGLQPMKTLGPSNTAFHMESTILFENKTVLLVFHDSTVDILDGEGRYIRRSAYTFSSAEDVTKFNIATYENTIIVTHYDGKIRPVYLEMSILDSGELSYVGAKVSNVAYFPWVAVEDIGTVYLTGVATLNANANRTLHCTGNYFTADMAGEFIRIEGITKVENGNRLASNAYEIISVTDANTALVRSKINLSNGTDFMANFEYDFSGGDFDSFEYQPKTDTTNNFTVVHQSAWSDRLGWPRTVTVDESRVIYGGNKTYPATIWGSMVGNQYNFLDKRFISKEVSWSTKRTLHTITFSTDYSGSILETDPYQFTLSTRRGSAITFMESSVNFVVGTSNQEYIISGNGAAISQKNISARPHTSHGSKPAMSVTYDNTVLFAGRSGQTLYLFAYNEANGSYVTKEVSVLHDELLEDGIESIAWHEELGVAFIVTAGKLVSLTLNNDTGATAFAEHNFSGTVTGVSYGIAPSSNRDVLYVQVKDTSHTVIYKLDRKDFEFLSFDFFNIKDKFSYMDEFRMHRISQTETLMSYNATLDYWNYEYQSIKIGDRVTFTDDDPTALDGSGIALNTEYFVIPFDSNQSIGFRLALTLADAMTNTYIDLLATGTYKYFQDISGIQANFTKTNQTIPTSHYPAGTALKVFATQGSGVEEFEIETDGNDVYDLGQPYYDVALGKTYKFHIATTPLEAGNQWGSSQLGVKRIDKASVRVYETRSFKIGTDGYNMENREQEGLFTGTDQVAVTANSEYDQILHITNEEAEGCYISGITMRGVSNDG